MDIREIIYINKVAEFKNITKAAEELHITQPSLTQSIKSIEHRIGTALFIRTKRGVELTDAGESFIRDSKALLQEYQVFLSRVNHYTKKSSPCSIGLYKLSHTTPVNQAILSYIARHEAQEFILNVESIEDLEKMLLENRINLAIIKYTPLHQRNENFIYDVLFQERLYVLVSKSNPLSSMETLSMKDLIGNKLISSAKNEYPYQMMSDLLQKSGIDLEIHTYMNYANLTMIMNLVENDLGVTFATRDVCEYYKNHKVSFIPLEPAVHYDICIVQNKNNADDAQNQSLIAFIKDSVE